MLGTDPKQIAINDMAVNPQSGTVYLSVSRGRGPDAIPLLVRINADGKPEEFSLENVHFAKADLPNAPANDRQRVESSLTAAIRVYLLRYFCAASTDEGHRLAGHGQRPHRIPV